MLESRSTSRSLDVARMRNDFPIFNRRVHGKRLVYLDNAATTQKPKQVIDAISDYYSNYNANIHRSVHLLAEEATEAFEGVRSKLRRFVNARYEEELIFTRNATEALNIAANSTTSPLSCGDKIVVTEMEHHSNFVPWQQFAKRLGAKLEIVPINSDCEIDESELDSRLTGAKVFALSHMSNVLGTINDAKRLTRIAHEKGAIVVLDGAQSAPHVPINLQEIDCDFFALSAH